MTDVTIAAPDDVVRTLVDGTKIDLRYVVRSEQTEAIGRVERAKARENFWLFRCLMRPDMIRGWWQRHLAEHLQEFYEDYLDGRRPKLVIQAPPQHGKSESVRDFIAWFCGKDPRRKVIFTSYSNELGTTTNIALQRMFTSEAYRGLFSGTRVRALGDRSTDVARRNTGVIEFIGHPGSFRKTTIEGQITGMGLDLGIIDDPIKGRAEASSPATRNMTWNWLTDDFFARFAKDAGMIMIMTRWHLDDPVGRWLERFPDTKVLSYPAIAEANDWSVREGYRAAGEALFEEHKPLDFLMERKQLLSQGGWMSEYQQTPIVTGGGIFPVDRISVVQSVDRANIMKSVRYIDKAGSQDAGAYTAMVLMHKMKDGRYVVEDVSRGQWSALDRERRIRQVAENDRALCRSYSIYVEQEPGSGGKESAESTIRSLAGYRAFADRVTGSKETRADPFAAQVQNGNVIVKASTWLRDYFDELETFPAGKYKDQVDASSGAFNKLSLGSSYDTTMSWV